jgi:hypothetical protein
MSRGRSGVVRRVAMLGSYGRPVPRQRRPGVAGLFKLYHYRRHCGRAEVGAMRGVVADRSVRRVRAAAVTGHPSAYPGRR